MQVASTREGHPMHLVIIENAPRLDEMFSVCNGTTRTKSYCNSEEMAKSGVGILEEREVL